MSHFDRPYFVTMGTYQMAILLLFNEYQQLTLNEIEEATKINTKELEKQIVSLIENKILLGNIVSDTSQLFFNDIFVSFFFKE
jgi:hypothetical protein